MWSNSHKKSPGRGALSSADAEALLFSLQSKRPDRRPRDLPAITPDSFKIHLRAELAGDEAAKLKASRLSSAQIAALSTMKQHTDFNDLAHKSELGIKGVKRQIGAAISQVQREEQQHQEQKHVEKKQQQIEPRPRRTARIGLDRPTMTRPR